MSLVAMSGNQFIDGLLWGVRWDAASLTYGFATQTSQYSGYQVGTITGFQAFNAQQRAAATQAVGQLNSIVSLDVVFTNDPSLANLRFAEASSVTQIFDPNTFLPIPGVITTAVGTPPDDFFVPPFAHGDMFFNSTMYNTPKKGNFAYATVIHEMGHTLGLKHGHIVQPFPDQSFEIPALPTQFDSMEFSIMTYRSNIGGPTDHYRNEDFGYAQSWMMFDIAALQYLYGADFKSNAGRTTYTWSETTGEMFINGVGQGTPGANRVFLTIWDGNGVDTYNMANYSTNVSINLAPGSFSVTSNAQLAVLNTEDGVKSRGNVFNALLFDNDLRSLIENALGGSGNDRITGNTASNNLRGNDGSDKLNGLEGRDVLIGGDGNDRLVGGEGNDSLYGGKGKDVLNGGDGGDRFLYNSTTEIGDTIAGFSSAAAGNDDRFEFLSTAFGNLPEGVLAPGRFQSSASAVAQAANTRFFFETDTGILRFDRDGNNNGFDAIVVATLLGNVTMTAGDIFLV